MNKENIELRPVYIEQWKPESPGDTIRGEIEEPFSKIIENELVPFVTLRDSQGDYVNVCLGSAFLKGIYYSGELKPGRTLIIRYDGESTKIKKKKNAAKLFSFAILDEKGNKIHVPVNRPVDYKDPYEQPWEQDDRSQKAMNNAAKRPQEEANQEGDDLPF